MDLPDPMHDLQGDADDVPDSTYTPCALEVQTNAVLDESCVRPAVVGNLHGDVFEVARCSDVSVQADVPAKPREFPRTTRASWPQSKDATNHSAGA